jgi:hypothetical protein
MLLHYRDWDGIVPELSALSVDAALPLLQGLAPPGAPAGIKR